jgi:hypothetical protein
VGRGVESEATYPFSQLAGLGTIILYLIVEHRVIQRQPQLDGVSRRKTIDGFLKRIRISLLSIFGTICSKVRIHMVNPVPWGCGPVSPGRGVTFETNLPRKGVQPVRLVSPGGVAQETSLPVVQKKGGVAQETSLLRRGYGPGN